MTVSCAWIFWTWSHNYVLCSHEPSPWHNCNGWLGLKHRVTDSHKPRALGKIVKNKECMCKFTFACYDQNIVSQVSETYNTATQQRCQFPKHVSFRISREKKAVGVLTNLLILRGQDTWPRLVQSPVGWFSKRGWSIICCTLYHGPSLCV